MQDSAALEALERKLDAMGEQMARLSDAWEGQREWHALAADMAPVLRAAQHTARAQLAALEPEANYGDLLYLLRHVVANVGDIIAALEQLESLRDLLTDAAPLTVEVSESLIERLDELERRGYFALAREALGALDAVAQALGPAGVRELADRAPAIVATTKRLSEPDILNLASDMALQVQRAQRLRQADPPSLLGLLARLRQAEVRRGLAVALELLRGLGTPPQAGVAESAVSGSSAEGDDGCRS